MDIKPLRRRNSVTVHIDGELDHHSATAVREQLDSILSDENVNEIVLDLTGLRFMDSSGIGVILGRYKALKARKGRLRAINLSAQVTRVFEVSGLFNIIDREAN